MSNVYRSVILVYLLACVGSTGFSLNKIQHNLLSHVLTNNGRYYRNTSFVSSGDAEQLPLANEHKTSLVKAHRFSLFTQSSDDTVVKAVVFNPQNKCDKLRVPFQLPATTLFSEMEALVKRGIPMKALKHIYFHEEVDFEEIIGEDPADIPPFLPSKDDKRCKLLGRDISYDMDEHDEQSEIDSPKYPPEDIICQTLISSILENVNNTENPRLKPPEEISMEEEGLKADILEDFYVPDEHGLPYILYKWNKSYLQGLETVDPSQKENYSKMWYSKLEWFLLHFVERFKHVLEMKRKNSSDDLYEDTSQDKRPKIKIGTKLLKLRPWTEYLSPHILEFIAKTEKYNRVVSSKKPTPDQLDDIRAEVVKVFLKESKNPFFARKLEKEQEKRYREYIRFCYDRRHRFKGKPRSLYLMPFWIWHDFWRDRKTFFQTTLHDIINDILLTDPNANLKEITDGTLERAHSKMAHGTKYDSQMDIRDECVDPTILELKGIIDKQEKFRKPAEPETEKTDSTDKFPSPLGYYFKHVLSFSAFEDAYRQFNMENLGVPDHEMHIGQIVKGTVYFVTPDEVLVDIHSFTLATLPLRNYFKTPSEVPVGGFQRLFKEGDELMFEVTEIWPNNITLSLNRIKSMSKFEQIFSKYEKNHIFHVRVLQRYTRGLLVQYTTNTSSCNDNSVSFKNIDELQDIAWVPINELSLEHRSHNQLINMNIVGKTIPVIYDHYNYTNDIPVLSNIRATRRLLLLYLKPYDVVKGPVTYYNEDCAVVRLGDLSGFLHVTSMNEATYQQHISGYSHDVPAVVTGIDVNRGFVQLSTKLLSDIPAGSLSNVNSHRKKYRMHRDSVRVYNSSRYPQEGIRNTSEEASMNNYSGVEIMGALGEKGGIFPIADPTRASPRGGNKCKKWNLLDGDFLKDSVMHAFNIKRWQIYTQEGWKDIPEAEQMVFNRGYNNNDDIAYYKSKGVQYKIDFTRSCVVDLDSETVYRVRAKDS